MPGVVQEPLAGCIKWLPHKERLIPADPEIDEGCCNHPVVVLSTRPRNGKVEVLIITSFGGEDLETKFPTRRPARLNHLPIAPNKAHPDSGILLVLRDSSNELRKKSYVNIRDKHGIHLRSLKPYNRRGPEIFLSKRSYQTLVKHAQFVEPQEEHLLPRLAETNTPRSSVYDRYLERRDRIERYISEEDTASVSDFYTSLAEHDRISQTTSNSRSANNYPIWPTASAGSLGAARPLLAASRTYTRLLTTHLITTSDGSGSSGLWKSIKMFFYVLSASLISYGLYRAGRSYWASVRGTPVLALTRKTFESAGGKSKSIWESFLPLCDGAWKYRAELIEDGYLRALFDFFC